METKHRKGAFLLAAEQISLASREVPTFLENKAAREFLWEKPKSSPEVLREFPPRYIVAMTGTGAKRDKLLDISIGPMSVYLPGEVAGFVPFPEAGNAPEPVTADPIELMSGKQHEQIILLQEALAAGSLHDFNGRPLKDGDRITAVSNDINTVAAEHPLHKSILQKNKNIPLDQHQYAKLLMAALKFWAAQESGVDLGVGYEDLLGSWELVDKVLGDRSLEGKMVTVPVKFQSIDAFEHLRVVKPSKSPRKFEYDGPNLIVDSRGYAHMVIDWSRDERIFSMIGRYFLSNWGKDGFSPNRYPLGIRWKDLISALAGDGHDATLIIGPYGKGDHRDLERFLDGYSRGAAKIQRDGIRYFNKQHGGKRIVVTRKPNSQYEVRMSDRPK